MAARPLTMPAGFQVLVGQAGNRTGSAVDSNRAAAASRTNGNAVGQFKADLVVGNRGLDIGIAGIFDGFAQFYGVVCTLSAPILKPASFNRSRQY